MGYLQIAEVNAYFLFWKGFIHWRERLLPLLVILLQSSFMVGKDG